MTAIPLKDGDQAFLIPRTLTCPRECWQRPEVTVISIANTPVFVVQLPDGRQIRVHEDDVVRRLPNPPAERRVIRKARPELVGAEEVPLW